jgi:hypothetical protein
LAGRLVLAGRAIHRIVPLLFGAGASWPHGAAVFFFLFFFAADQTNHHPVLPERQLPESRVEQPLSSMQRYLHRPGRAGPGESRVRGPRSAGNHQCKCNASFHRQQSPAVAAGVQRAVIRATDRRQSFAGRLAAKATHC